MVVVDVLLANAIVRTEHRRTILVGQGHAKLNIC